MKKIHVIDDDVQFNKMICTILTKSGYEVDSAHNGADGLKLFQKMRPDLIIIDIYMPEKEGLETIQELRKLDKEIKILAVSGGNPNMNMDIMFKTATIFGANAILAKPFDIDTLQQEVMGLIGG